MKCQNLSLISTLCLASLTAADCSASKGSVIVCWESKMNGEPAVSASQITFSVDSAGGNK